MKTTQEKYNDLKEYLRSLGSVAVAFSSGVDSTFLLRVAHDVLGDRAIAVTAVSCSFPERSAGRITSDRCFASQKSLISMDFEAIRRIAATCASTNCLRKS